MTPGGVERDTRYLSGVRVSLLCFTGGLGDRHEWRNMADRNGLKGNPASKRISNVAAKNKRARSWARRERQKEENRTAQAERARVNKAAELTPWQIAKAARYARRHTVTLAA